MSSKLFKIILAATILASGPALADWSTSVVSLGQSSVGASGQVDCAPGGTPGAVWGVGTYTSDSSICGAAQHFGWIPPGGGGVVSYQTVPGQAAYQGVAQNGVTSLAYGSWSLSFQITGITPFPAPGGGGGGGTVTPVTWTTTLDQLGYAQNAGASYQFACPGGGSTASTIWGTDLYTSDSAICVAATHRGLIQPGGGGVVSVLVLGNQPAYAGSSRNGVTSSSYPEWPTSYTFQ